MQHAKNLNKPIVIHTREAEEDTFNFMKQYLPSDYKIDVHCFTDSLSFAQKLLAEWSNLYIGIIYSGTT
jgi:TatD DNase family protein